MMRVEIQRRERLLDDFFKVDEVVLRHELTNGEMSQPLRRLNFERGDGVAALLYKRQAASIVLVRQFRYPTLEAGPGWIVELVAGMLDAAEAPEDAMRREILEETGYVVEELAFVSMFYLSPGGSSERIHLYCAEVDDAARRAAGGGREDEGEDIEVVEWPLEQAWQALESGELADAKTIIALMWLRRRLEREREKR